MSDHKNKLLLSFIALGTVIAGTLFALSSHGVSVIYAKGRRAALTFSDFYVPTSYDPWGTTSDSSGNVWVAIPGCDPSPSCASTTPPGSIAEFNPTTKAWIASYNFPSGYGQALFLAFNGANLWFAMPVTNAIGVFNTSSHTYQQWTVPTASSGPWDVAADTLGNIWFTEHYSNKIGKFNTSTHTFQEISTPATNSIPYGITVDKSNNVWFTENNDAVALIGEYTAGGVLKEYKIRNGSMAGSGLTPHLITIDPNGNVWWSEGFVARIAELKVSQAVPGTNKGVTEYPYAILCSNCGTHTSGISVSNRGIVWFDDSNQNTYGSFSDSGKGKASVYFTKTTNSHPHDGLHVDSQNRVWFDEEFVNKLALVIP